MKYEKVGEYMLTKENLKNIAINTKDVKVVEVDLKKTNMFSIGQQFNNEVLVIHFINLPNLVNKYIYYKIDDIEEEVPLVSDVFIVSRPLMLHSGEVKAQIIARNPNTSMVELTQNFTMRIKPSNYSGIGEDENYPDDPNIKNYYVKIDGKIQSMDELIALVQSKLDNGEFIGAQGPRGEKGEPGEKGDPGSVTKEFKDLASQIAQNASDAQASATNAQTSASNAQKALDDTKAFANQTKSELNQIKTDTSALKEEANASAVNAKASETKAKEYADSLKASTDDISKLKEDLVANTKEDAKTKRSLSALWALNNGISYRFETDSEKAYQKQIPSGAKLGSVNKVGGKTIVMNQYANIEGVETAWGQEIGDSEKNKELSNHKIYVKHKYVIKRILNDNRDTYIKQLIIFGDSIKKIGETILKKEDIVVGKESTVSEILQAPNNVNRINVYNIGDNSIGLSVVCDAWVNIIDLTKMFGSGNEPSTSEEFEAMLPNDYYPYNEGELMSMSVNDIDVIGKNIFESKGFSCSSIANGNSLELSNNYGTSINSVAPSYKVTVTQSKAEQEDLNTSYLNGYLCIALKPFSLSKEYVFSFDVIPSHKLISDAKIIVLLNGNDSINIEYDQNLQIGKKSKLCFSLKVKDEELRYIEIRNSGISGVFENFQIEEGSINTDFSPFTKKSYPIPQSIQNLDGYGWSAGTAYNYVDFENRKYYKSVDRVDLGTLTWLASGGTSGDVLKVFVSNTNIESMKLTDKGRGKNFICDKFNLVDKIEAEYNSYDFVVESKASFYPLRFCVPNDFCTDESDFKKKVAGTTLYFELAKPIVTDISETIGDTFQEPFEVENGGTLTFKNTNGDGYQIAVPSDIQYTVALS